MIFFKKTIFFILRNTIPHFIIKKKKIIFISQGYSGCSARALYSYFKNHHKEILIEISSYSLSTDTLNLYDYIKELIFLSKATVLITTHGPLAIPNRIELNTWHSPLFKAVIQMENPSKITKLKTNWKNVNTILSYSQLYTSLMVACTFSNPYRHQISGIPRNDYLFISHGRQNLEKILKIKLNKNKIILFTPTFRKGYSKVQGSKNFENIFGFKDFDLRSLNNFLSENSILLIYKLHPNEEHLFRDFKNELDPENFLELNNNILLKYNFDLYELMNATDILITDYSGIFIDFLLLNRPIIFTPIDLEDYTKNRNFLFGPYDEWTPGKKVISQKNLLIEIEKILNGIDSHKQIRVFHKNIWHYYQDEFSSKRVAKIILSMLKERET